MRSVLTAAYLRGGMGIFKSRVLLQGVLSIVCPKCARVAKWELRVCGHNSRCLGGKTALSTVFLVFCAIIVLHASVHSCQHSIKDALLQENLPRGEENFSKEDAVLSRWMWSCVLMVAHVYRVEASDSYLLVPSLCLLLHKQLATGPLNYEWIEAVREQSQTTVDQWVVFHCLLQCMLAGQTLQNCLVDVLWFVQIWSLSLLLRWSRANKTKELPRVVFHSLLLWVQARRFLYAPSAIYWFASNVPSIVLSSTAKRTLLFGLSSLMGRTTGFCANASGLELQ